MTIKPLLSSNTAADIPDQDSSRAFGRRAICAPSSRQYGERPLEKMHTHTFGLNEVDLVVRTLAGRVESQNAIQVMVRL